MRKIISRILILIFIIVLFIIYNVNVITKTFKTNEIKIISNTIGDNFNGLKIIHISDIHYGKTVDKDMLSDIVNEINLNKPDIVVLTGDLLNKNIEYNESDCNDIIENLKNINTTLGKYAIKGDNDTSSYFEKIISDSGFEDISDASRLIYSNSVVPIIISGISNIEKINEISEGFDNYIENLRIKPSYSILLIHEPDYIDNINLNNYNLILSGHSLGGINILFNRIKLPVGAKKYVYGKYEVKDSVLYVSNGLGINDIKFRFMNKPSINFYRITK